MRDYYLMCNVATLSFKKMPALLSRQILFLYSALVSAAIPAEDISIGISEYCPITCNADSAQPHGIAITILEAAFPNSQYTLTYRVQPFMRSVAQAIAGEITAVATVDNNPNQQLIVPKHFVFSTRACTFTRPESNWTYKPLDLSSLEGQKIGLIHYYDSSFIDHKLKELGNEVVHIYPTEKSVDLRLLKMILSHRVDTGFLPEMSAQYLIKKNEWHSKLRASGCGVKIYTETVAFSAHHRKAQDYANLLDQTYLKLVKTGAYEKLLQQYGLPTSINASTQSPNPLSQ